MIRIYAIALIVTCICSMYFISTSPSMLGEFFKNNITHPIVWTLFGHLVVISVAARLAFKGYGILFNNINKIHLRLFAKIENQENKWKQGFSYLALGIIEGIGIHFVVAGFFFLKPNFW